MSYAKLRRQLQRLQEQTEQAQEQHKEPTVVLLADPQGNLYRKNWKDNCVIPVGRTVAQRKPNEKIVHGVNAQGMLGQRICCSDPEVWV